MSEQSYHIKTGNKNKASFEFLVSKDCVTFELAPISNAEKYQIHYRELTDFLIICFADKTLRLRGWSFSSNIVNSIVPFGFNLSVHVMRGVFLK